MKTQSKPVISTLIEFLERLHQEHIPYRLEHHRPESILVDLAVPGERWEVEFLEDGEIEVERFVSDGSIHGSAQLDSLFDLHGNSKG